MLNAEPTVSETECVDADVDVDFDGLVCSWEYNDDEDGRNLIWMSARNALSKYCGIYKGPIVGLLSYSWKIILGFEFGTPCIISKQTASVQIIIIFVLWLAGQSILKFGCNSFRSPK